MGAACSRRQKAPPPNEKPFWEELDHSKKAPEPKPVSVLPSTEDSKTEPLLKEPAAVEEDEPPRGYEQAAHLKEEGNEKLAKGDVNEALKRWDQALSILGLPPGRMGPLGPPLKTLAPLLGKLKKDAPVEDPRILELRAALFLNMAVGHKRLKQWRQAVACCDEALLDQPGSMKALFRKADALGELCEWKEAEEVAVQLEELGDEGAKLATQKREEWKKRRKAADGKQKKMWSAALTETTKGGTPEQKNGSADAKNGKLPKEPGSSPKVEEGWTAPKISQMAVFDLRQKGHEWDEAEDFNDSIWKDGLGRKDVGFFQQRALPLSVLAASAHAGLDVPSQSALVIHVILDGNNPPFAQPHNWTLFLQRCPQVKSLTVVYVDIGQVPDESQGPPPMPYGVLLRPTEEGRVGDRVARAARFLGTYREFVEHCRELPGLVRPRLAFWADVPLYGFGEDDLGTRLEALELLGKAGVPSVITQGGEIPAVGGPPMVPRHDQYANISMAILGVGVQAKLLVPWSWNRFVVPLDRSPHGLMAAHALLCVVSVPAKSFKPQAVRELLTRRGVALTAFKLPSLSINDDVENLRRHQWQVFCEKLRESGRPVGPNVSEEERRRQSMEFYQFCGMTEVGGA